MMRWSCLYEGRARALEPPPPFHFPILPGKAEVPGHPMDSQLPIGQQWRSQGHGWGKEGVSRKLCMKGRLAFLDGNDQWGPK